MSNESFLPANYEAPKASSGNYTKLQDGETRLRILSNPIFGFEYWNTEGKPVRVREKPSGKPMDMRMMDNNGREEKIKEFWAMKVYNYGEKQMQVCQITQAQIKNALAELSRDQDWGHPKQYDLKIVKSGKGLETKYAVTPVVPKPVSDEVRQAFVGTPINLEALFDGGEVFPAGGTVQEPAPAPKPAPKPAPAPAAPVAAGNEPDDLPF